MSAGGSASLGRGGVLAGAAGAAGRAGPPEAHRPSLGATCPALDAQYSGLEHVAHQAAQAACRCSNEFEVAHQDRGGWPLDTAAPEPRGVFAAIYWPSSRVRSSSRPPRRASSLYFHIRVFTLVNLDEQYYETESILWFWRRTCSAGEPAEGKCCVCCSGWNGAACGLYI